MNHLALYTSDGVTSGTSYVNAAFSFVLILLILSVLIRYNRSFNLAERIGYGIAGSSAFLSMFKQLGFAHLMLPFNDLYQAIWRVGWILVVGGKIWRMERHAYRNRLAISEAKKWRANKENA